MSKRVALVSPGKDWRFALSEPLNIGFIGSYLEDKINAEVKIIDEVAGHDVEKEIDQFSPDIVGITSTTATVTDAYRIVKACKERKILTVMGGVHASVLPDEVLKHADIAVKGEGEKAMLDIVKNNIKKGLVSRSHIKDLSKIPQPMRVEEDMNFYSKCLKKNFLHFVDPKSKAASIITSRGCPYNCLFCHNTWRGIPFRFNTPKKVEEEVEYLAGLGVKSLFFIDDNLFVSKKHLKEICKITTKFDLEWCCNSRVDNIDVKTLKMVKEAGCGELSFGFETGSQKILDILNKRTTVEQNRKAVELCKKLDIKISGSFILGNPTETLEDIELTRKFVEESNIDRIGFCIATPFPGTGLWEWCKKKNRVPKNFKWSDFDYINIPINCSEIPTDKLQKVFDDLSAMVIMERKSIPELIFRAVKFPDKTIKHLPTIMRTSVRRLRSMRSRN